MSRAADCPSCMAGEHAGHDPKHGIREGLIGGTYCACTGDCAERGAKEFARLFGDMPDVVLPPEKEN